MIKAIETVYADHRFRSRLEARWAVFFNALGVKWVYEPEGYELPSGRYLPDFYLPKQKLHVEVKPGGICEHANAFRDHVGAIAVTCGLPGEGLHLWCYDCTDSSGGCSDWRDCKWGFNSQAQLSIFVDSGRRDRDFYYDSTWTQTDCIIRGVPKMTLRMRDAISAAKQARFEHGARPR